MELRDYARMLKRGWPTVVLITALFLVLATLYLVLAPKRYEADTTLFVSANDPQNISDLQQGSVFAVNAVATYAKIVNSSAVLGPVATDLRPRRTVDELAETVTAAAPESTALIEIVAAEDDPGDAAAVANAVAVTAVRVLPTVQSGPDGTPLVRVQQTRPATRPTAAVSPDVKRVLALGLILGLCAGLATTITVQSLDTRLRQVDDLRALTEVPLVAVLPAPSRAERHGIAVRDDPAGAIGEAFRTLRTNLRFLESKERRSVVFTAVTADRDGAQVPANLAWSLVQAGWSVLLVDLDMRRTAVGDAFAMRGGPGLADVLTDQVELPDIVRETSHPWLHVVTAGTPQASPGDLLSAPTMTTVLRAMEQAYDYVVMHAPPLLSYTDAALVSDAAGATLLTVAAGRTKAQDLTTALGVLANVRVTPVGLVLTGSRASDRKSRSEARPVTRATPGLPPPESARSPGTTRSDSRPVSAGANGTARPASKPGGLPRTRTRVAAHLSASRGQPGTSPPRPNAQPQPQPQPTRATVEPEQLDDPRRPDRQRRVPGAPPDPTDPNQETHRA